MYDMGSKLEDRFYTLDGGSSYTIGMATSHLDKAKVRDKTTNQLISHTSKSRHIEFKVIEGHDYVVF